MNTTSNPFDEFLTKPRQYLLHYLQQKPRFDININMVKNGRLSICIVYNLAAYRNIGSKLIKTLSR